MVEFIVWDPLNDDRDDAKTIEAWSPIGAAEAFAVEDGDGHTDGLYEHPIAVEDPSGDVSVYLVAWVHHPESWHERLSECATIRARRLASDSERDCYLRGDVPQSDGEK